ncbi:MAG: hypothetical protein AAGH92_07970 [Planctomycetota bacterium]
MFLGVAAAAFAGPAFAVGWDDVRTIDFEEYKQAPRYTVGSDPWINIDSWTPPEGWADPINHRKDEIAGTDVRGWGFAWDGPRPDTFDLTRWSKRVKARGDVTPFGPQAISPKFRPGAWVTKLNVNAVDVAVDLNGYDLFNLPASGQWRGTVHGYREDASADFGTPERWVEVFTKDFDLPIPTRTNIGSGSASYVQTSVNFVNVELPGFSHLDRLAFTAVDPDGLTPDVTQFAVDNIQATAGATHAFFLGAPDSGRIESSQDINAMRGAMRQAFDLESYRQLVLPDVGLSQTPGTASASVIAELDAIKQRLAPGDNFVFYYSGHGVTLERDGQPNPTNGNEALFLGRDSSGDSVLLEDDLLTAYFAQDPIWSQIDKVFVLDACYSGGFWTSTPDVVGVFGRENNLSGATDLATLPRSALLAAAPESKQALSFSGLDDIADNGLPGTQDFGRGQGLLTAAVVSALQSGEDGYALADLNDDGLSFRELLEYVRVGDTNEIFGKQFAFDDERALRRMRRWLDQNGHRDVSVGWFLKSRFVGFERSDPFDPWATDPIEVDWEPFAALTDDFGTAGMMEPMTLLEIAAAAGGGLAGDFDNSGQVEQSDLNLVLNNWGSARADWGNADAFTTPNVDQEELNAVLNNWGAQSAPSFVGLETVPEPGVFGLGLGALALLGRKRH